MANVLLLICALFLISTSHFCGTATNSSDSRSVLYLLNIVPYPDSTSGAGWDRGLELIPAGEIAADEINNRSDVLPDHRLQLLNIDSEACGVPLVTNAVVNSYRYLVDPELAVVGVVGLFCSTVTDTMAPIADHPNISLLEIAGSTSPIHRDREKYPLLFETVSSSTNFNRAVMKMMDWFQWRRISLVHDSLGVFFISTADDFHERIRESEQLQLVTQEPIKITPDSIDSIFTVLRQEGGRIVHTIVTEPESAAILCQAYKKGYTWPGYAYIFNDRTVEDILNSTDSMECSREEAVRALEGVFLLNAVLTSPQDTVLVSGKTYADYYKEFEGQLPEGVTNPTPYANVMYDQVWAFSLALNNSLHELDARGFDIRDYRFGNSNVTSIFTKNLEKVSFQGASDHIQFNTLRETDTPVDILQVRDGLAHNIGVYYPSTDEIEMNESMENIYVPEDRFDSVNIVLPKWLSVILFAICGLCYILTTINLIVYLYWRNSRHVKATSPFLSLLIFLGCYVLYAAALIRTVYYSTFLENSTLYAVLCNSVIWFAYTGLNLILATLFVKLLRIYHVFHHFGRTSKLWSDPFLCLGSLVICLGGIVYVTVWTIVDAGQQEIKEHYVEDGDPQPYYELQAVCSSSNTAIWNGGAFAYSGLIFALVIFMGVQTRRIKRQDFKDTKKVNAYVGATILVSGIALPSFYVFSALEEEALAHVFLVVGFLLTAILCQLFLFLPKTLPLLKKKNRERRVRRGHTPRILSPTNSRMAMINSTR